MKSTDSGTKLLQGAFILSVAAILSKLIGTLQKIPLQNIAGDSVFGIYNTVYPFYMMFITLATAGFPIAVSKLVAEANAKGDREEGERVLRVTSLLLALLGGLLSIIMYQFAPQISTLIDNEEVVLSIRTASFAFLFVPVMTGLRGYFQGLQDMVPTAVSQITEQTARVTVMLVLLFILIERGAEAETVAAGAMLGSAAGGAAGLILMWIFWVRRRKRQPVPPEGPARGGNSSKTERKSTSALLISVLRYAIPVALGSIAVPLMNMVDTFTVPRLLKLEGMNDMETMRQFGVYNRGIPLVQLVTMLAVSLSVLFIPAIAEAKVRNDQRAIRKQSSLALKWFWLIGLAAAAGMAVLAQPINRMLYVTPEGTDTMRILALTAAGSAVSVIAAALLQGLGAVRAPALIMLAAAAVKTLLNELLVPLLGVSGAAWSSAAAYALAALLNALLLARLLQLRVSLSAGLLKPALVIAAMSLAAAGTAWGAETMTGAMGIAVGGRTTALVQSLLGIAAGIVIFVLGAVRTKWITAAELAMLPKGAKLVKLLRKLKMM
ncbi:polysaccharide biosynthesis protein [Paenibacillus sp. Marseille-Q4541]|uniref:putative polysaccharide biosynthesis protein n=1 Tax=Paenibacillus sp. Marseille-Q4541 TaxID=2831522 RepID=UPI001BA699A5|nr:polysaccharide biosynthesis protein [Paenibacillus sp. Marseille-Q4541]